MRNTIKKLTFIAIFSAISSILYMYVKFPLPIFPSFLEVNFSMIPIIICAFMLGPIEGAIVVLIRSIVKLSFGTLTGYVGELADILICIPTTLIAGTIYKYSKFQNKTLLSFVSISIWWVFFEIIANAFINIPFYGNLFGMEMVIGASKDAFKLISFGLIDNVNEANFINYYILFATIPFNLMLSLIIICVTVPIHKRLKNLYCNL